MRVNKPAAEGPAAEMARRIDKKKHPLQEQGVLFLLNITNSRRNPPCRRNSRNRHQRRK